MAKLVWIAVAVGATLIVAGLIAWEEPVLCAQSAAFECPKPSPAPGWLIVAGLLLLGSAVAAPLLLPIVRERRPRTDAGADLRPHMGTNRPVASPRSPRPREPREPFDWGGAARWLFVAGAIAIPFLYGSFGFLYDGYTEDSGSEPIDGVPAGIVSYALVLGVVVVVVRARRGDRAAAIGGAATLGVLVCLGALLMQPGP